jgi:hypothetical protein
MAAKSKAPLVDLNRATRDDLVTVAGLKPAVADAVLSRRDAVGSFVSHDALQGAEGINEQVLEVIRSSTQVLAEQGAKGLETGSTATTEAAATMEGAVAETVEATASAAREAAEMAGRIGTTSAAAAGNIIQDQAALARKASAGAGQAGTMAAQTGRRMGEAIADRGASVARTSTDLTAAWIAFWPEQMREGWQTAMALTRCRSLPEVIEVQTRFWQASMDRSRQLFRTALPSV